MASALDAPRAGKVARKTDAAASFFPRLKIALSPCASPLSFLGSVDLARCEGVSRAAHDATRAPQLWVRFDLDVPHRRCYSINVFQLPLARRLALNNGHGLGDPLFFRAYLRKTSSLRLLQSLDLSKLVDLSDASVEIVASQCPALASLSVASYRLTCATPVALARSCPNLRRISIGSCKNIKSLAPLGTGCAKLKEILCMFCEHVGDESFIAISRGCPFLTRLSVGGYDFTDEGIRTIAEGCPKLKSINIDYARGAISDAALEALGAFCPALVKLSAAFCTGLADRGAQAIIRGCLPVKSLTFQGAMGVSLEPIAAYVDKYQLADRRRQQLGALEEQDPAAAAEYEY